ncbi:MAG: type II toxin-antitoxin system PemK/MazF family toxin [Verrucomicrobiota bacterium]|jgi:mRNA-degrading endonuclease toxin of MazEF toxin-antitoxin module
MPSTTNFRRGDIILVPFPFTDLSSTKQRPALIVSSDALNAASDDVLVAAITSQIAANLTAEEFMIPSGGPGCLRLAEAIRCATGNACSLASPTCHKAYRLYAGTGSETNSGSDKPVVLSGLEPEPCLCSG